MEELWAYMHAVSDAAHREKLDGPLRSLKYIANRQLGVWRQKPELLYVFAQEALPHESCAHSLEESGHKETAKAVSELCRFMSYIAADGENLLQPTGVLAGPRRDKEVSRRCESLSDVRKIVVEEAGDLADLSARAKTHSTTNV